MSGLSNNSKRERSRDKTTTGSRFLYLDFLLKLLLCIMPLCLFLSYHPVIKLGESESMYFELSVAEIWLVVFDIVGFIALIQKRMLFRDCRKWWVMMLLPLWITLSVVWSLNTTRGILTAGLMWCVVMAVYIIWTLRDKFDPQFRRKWLGWFLGSTLVVCLWCVVQCVLDLVGVPQNCSLLCNGCTYRMFGFPHPNGFAIEPQFMGNLLLAPTVVMAWLLLVDNCNSVFRGRVARARRYGASALILGRASEKPLKTLLSVASKKNHDNGSSLFLCFKFLLFCFFITIMTLFLTFSRGAIYAFIVGMLFMSGYAVARSEKKKRSVMWKRVGMMWGCVVGAFVVALVGQGMMAEVSPTSDTFSDGVAKVVNHLSLGIIDLKGKSAKTEVEPVEKPVEKSGGKKLEEDSGGGFGEEVEEADRNGGKEEAVFSGYVAESTDTRVRLSGAALQIWSSDFKTMVLGIGIGGAGQALYNNGLSPAPREIVQNEYASLLLETGLVGVILAVIIMVFVIKWMIKGHREMGLVLSLLVAYGVSLMFFSGLPNALHIYLMPVMIMILSNKERVVTK